MAFVAEKWSETIACGRDNRHEVVFAMTPWNGVEIAFNPCDAIPATIGFLRTNRCRSHDLLAKRNLALQSIWFGEPYGSEVECNNELRSKIIELFIRRHTIARHILNANRSELETNRPASDELTWAKLTSYSAVGFGTQQVSEISNLLESNNAMMQLHALATLMQLAVTPSTRVARRETLECMLHAFQHNSLPSFFRVRLASRLAESGTREVLAALIERTSQDRLQRDCVPQVQLCIKQMRQRQGAPYAFQSLLEALSAAHERLSISIKLWYSLLGNLRQAKAYDLVAFAADQSPSVRTAIALVVCSEQNAKRNRVGLLRALDDFPEMAPQLVDCVLCQLREAPLSDRGSLKFVQAALGSSLTAVRHTAAVILLSNFLRDGGKAKDKTEMVCDAQ